MKTNAKNLILYTCFFVYLFILMINALLIPVRLAYAETTEYSTVLDDLTEDENFNVADYSTMTVDYILSVNSDEDTTNDQPLLEVIQVTESSAKELYIYVYQPTDEELEITATSITLSCEFSENGEDINPRMYDLELVSTYTVFDKYVVKDFIVNDEVYRYYNIVGIFREYKAELDEVVSGGILDGYEKAIEVGQQWCFSYVNNELKCEMNTFETVEVTIKYLDGVEFRSGLKLKNFLGESDLGIMWFICFDVEDYVVKHIYDADVSYKTRSMDYGTIFWFFETKVNYGDWDEDYTTVTLTDIDGENGMGSYDGGGWLSKEYTWNRISSSSDFLTSLKDQNLKISEEAEAGINNSQWVFAYCETALTKYTSANGGSEHYYGRQAGQVSILRMHFKDIHDDVYNLGVVSDKVTPDHINGITGSGIDLSELTESFSKMLSILAVIALLVLLGVATPVLKYILDFVIWLVKLPFKVIKNLWKGK